MVTLDKSDGSLKIEELIINSSLGTKQLEAWSELYSIKLKLKNDEYIHYMITNIDKGETSLSIFFYRNTLSFISIELGENYANDSPFVITSNKRHIIKTRLEILGGEKKYPWGTVEYSESIKDGMVSVVVKYV
jgi:hypothetical protein